MSKIDDLIKQYCPNGVEYKELGEICNFKRGKTITAKDVTLGDVPVIAGGQKPAYYHNEANRYGETIVVSSSGAYAGYVSYWTIPVFLSDSFSVEPKQDLIPKYAFYFLKNLQDKIYGMKKGSGVPHIHSSDLVKIKIPVPPLPVQEEIVRVLDTFTALEAELEAELEARKRQYEYYRNKLLTFDENTTGGGISWKMLSEVCNFKNGKGHEQNICNEGTYIVVNSKFISTGGVVKKYVDEQICPVYKNDILMVMSDLPNGKALAKCFLVSKNNVYSLNQRICALTVKNPQDTNEKFLYYVLDRNKQLLRYDNGVDQTNLRKDDILKIHIPIPPLDEQERIVAILDKFDSLVNDISEGLPAELNARRQQYEYYRNKLLTFKPLASKMN